MPPKWCDCEPYHYDPVGAAPVWYLIGEAGQARMELSQRDPEYWRERMARDFDVHDWDELTGGPLPAHILAMESIQYGIEVAVSSTWSFYRLSREEYEALKTEAENNK